MSAPKLFTTEWAEKAYDAEKSKSDIIRIGFQDPGAFTHVLALEATDLAREIYFDYVAGSLVSIEDQMEEDRVWARFSGTADAWRQAADGTQPAANLVMGAKLKLTKGTIPSLVANAEAFNRLNVAFGTVETDYSA